MAKVKAIAVQFRWAVARKDSAMIQKFSNGLTRADFAALAILYADCCDGQKLLALTKTGDDGLPEVPAHVA